MKMDWTKIAMVGAGAIGAVYIVRSLGKSAVDTAGAAFDAAGKAAVNVGKSATKPIADSIADTYLSISLPGQVRLNGVVLFPDGSKRQLSGLRVSASSGDLRFVDRGTLWQIVSRSGSEYLAQPVPL